MGMHGFRFACNYLSYRIFCILMHFDALIDSPDTMSRLLYALFVLAVYYIFTLFIETESLRSALLFNRPLKGLALGAAIGLALLALSFIVGLITKTMVVTSWHVEFAVVGQLLGAWLITQLLISVKELVALLGYSQRRLTQVIPSYAAILLVAVAFGVLQYYFVGSEGVVLSACMGLLLGYLYHVFDNIYVPMGVQLLWGMGAHTLLSGKVFAMTESSQQLLGHSYSQAYVYCAITLIVLLAAIVRQRMKR